MRALLIAILALFPVLACAQVYTCPQVYPDKDKPAAPLTGASMRQAEPSPSGYMTDEEAAEEGYDAHYAFDPDEPAWLVCWYGGNKRVKGRFHDGHEWNQRMASADYDWETKLAPRISKCTVQTREIKARNPRKSTWTVTAQCQSR